MKLSGKAKVAGVMGWPVGHSRSPMLHGHWLRRYGIDGAYVPMAVRPEKIGEALSGLAALGFAGCNLTLPHKELALPYLAEIDDTAKRIGAVNTIVVRPDGGLAGSNTDAFGFLENLKAGAPRWRAAAGAAVMVGAGGAARAVGVALADAGVPEIRILNRTRARAEALASGLGPKSRVIDWGKRTAALDGAALLINTSSLGMAGQPPLELPLDALPQDAVVNDIVYVPLETPLLADARRRGHTVVDGLGMLLHQGRPGFRAWFGVDPEVTQDLWDLLAADIRK